MKDINISNRIHSKIDFLNFCRIANYRVIQITNRSSTYSEISTGSNTVVKSYNFSIKLLQFEEDYYYGPDGEEDKLYKINEVVLHLSPLVINEIIQLFNQNKSLKPLTVGEDFQLVRNVYGVKKNESESVAIWPEVGAFRIINVDKLEDFIANRNKLYFENCFWINDFAEAFRDSSISKYSGTLICSHCGLIEAIKLIPDDYKLFCFKEQECINLNVNEDFQYSPLILDNENSKSIIDDLIWHHRCQEEKWKQDQEDSYFRMQEELRNYKWWDDPSNFDNID